MVLHLEALAAIALSLSILMAIAWTVQQRTGNFGWVDTIWTFSVGLVGVDSALWPIGGAAPNARQWLVAALVAIWSLWLGSHMAARTAGITDDPRYAAFAKSCRRNREWSHELRVEDYRHPRASAAARPHHPRRDPAALLAHRDAARQRQRGKRRLVC
jgi:steroid 5-alpha reductase family enzyme